VRTVSNDVCDFVSVSVRALKEKRHELSTPNLRHTAHGSRSKRTDGDVKRSKVKVRRLSDALPTWLCRSTSGPILFRFLVFS